MPLRIAASLQSNSGRLGVRWLVGARANIDCAFLAEMAKPPMTGQPTRLLVGSSIATSQPEDVTATHACDLENFSLAVAVSDDVRGREWWDPYT